MDSAGLRYYRFEALLLQQGWIRPGYVGVDHEGVVRYLSDKVPANEIAVESVFGFAIPGIPNAHSHAFQYAMAGSAEKHQPGSSDDFWTWREAMYECALSMDPSQMEAIAAMLYSQMLRKGYTHVAEFHYLHHDSAGTSFSNPAEMGERLVAAAHVAGIKITLIPVAYQKGGFGTDPTPRQRRFITPTLDAYFRLLDDSRIAVQASPLASLGFGVHSLRAVSPNEVIRIFENGPRELPFHLHAAEQIKEVDDALAFLKCRPVEWILDNLPVNHRFHLVHCTHLNDDEVKQLGRSGANVVLCPGTEANLGDGIFKLRELARVFGNWCIGTDSQISLNPLEDMRWLDYGQRLISHQRNTFDDPATVQMNKCVPCGRRAMGLEGSNFFETGKPFDTVVYDAASPLLQVSPHEHLLPAIVYTADAADVFGTIVNGKWAYKKNEGSRNEMTIRQNYFKAIRELKR